jgi:hypothetical protein
MLNKLLLKMSFREKKNLNCVNLSDQRYGRSRTFKGLYISNKDAHYVIGTDKDFKDKIKTRIYEYLSKNLRIYYNNSPIRFTGVHNNLFVLEYYGRLIPGDVIIVKEDIKNMDESFHQTLGPKKKKFNAKKCDQCGDNLKYYDVRKLIGKQCEIASCSTPYELNHTHKLCNYCFDNQKYDFV